MASIKFQAYERNLRRIYMLDRDQRLDPNQQVRGFASMACQAEVGLNMVRIAPGAGPASRPTWLATKPVKN